MTTRQCVSIPLPAYLRDHVVDGQSVVPATEALQWLASEVKRHFPVLDVSHTSDARFLRLLPLGTNPGTAAGSLDALIELSPLTEDGIYASLLTKQQTKAGLHRTREHVSVCFGKAQPNSSVPIDDAWCLEGVCTVIPKTLLYGEMVPFGPSFQNVLDPIRFSRSGATAWLQAPELGSVPVTAQTGSVFVFDAALHLACGWSQYDSGIVTFPTGYANRQIINPTQPGEHYCCTVMPKGHTTGRFLFDILILDRNGNLRESARQVMMQDIFHGRLRAPTDLKLVGREFEEQLTALCPTTAIVEIAALSPAAAKALSPLEQERSKTMVEKRRTAFCAGRAALRIAARRFMEAHGLPLSANLEIGSYDTGAPWVRWPSMPELCYFAVSHDSRFAVALFDERPVGIDVEQLRDTAYHHRKRFLSEQERSAVESSALDPDQSALRAWSIKEAAVKMFLQPLGTIWNSLTIRTIDSEESSFEYNGKLWKAQHADFDDHVVTVIKSPVT